MYITIKNAKLKNVKKIGMLVGAYAPHASKLWCQHNVAQHIEEEVNNVEIKIENVHQQDYVGRAVVVCIAMDE